MNSFDKIISDLQIFRESKILYLTFPLENFNFKNDNVSIRIEDFKSFITINISKNLDDLILINSLLKSFLSDFEMVFTWDIKNIITYFQHYINADFIDDNLIFDLKIIKFHYGKEKIKPANLNEALSCFKDNYDSSFIKIYKKFYWPQITKLIPSIEKRGIIDSNLKQVHYPYYEFYQNNGRFNSRLINNNCYNPHSLSAEEKKKYKPVGVDYSFVFWDYKNFEVSVLQWLTGDLILNKCLESNHDCYSLIWQLVSEQESDELSRKLIKRIFLPIIYGQGVTSLSKANNIDIKICKFLYERINKIFNQSIVWMKGQSKVSEKYGFIIDKFERKRCFNKDYYKSMNSIVQMTSAYIFQYKLLDLYNKLPKNNFITHHVHDSIVVSCPTINLNHIELVGSNILEDTSDFKNLKLKVSHSNNKTLYEGDENEINSK